MGLLGNCTSVFDSIVGIEGSTRMPKVQADRGVS